jgi:hypothetical protein
VDRAGHTEWDYLGDGKWIYPDTPDEEFVYELYDQVCADWRAAPFPWEKDANKTST